MTQLPSKVEYHDINGEEALEILHTRFWDFIRTLPELERRFALTRLILRLEITLDIYGAAKQVHPHYFEAVASETPPPEWESVGEHHQADIVVDSRSNAPDEIREMHGLPLPEARRQAMGFHETVYASPVAEARFQRPPPLRPAALLPANQANPNAKEVGKRSYAAWIEQDYGSLQQGERTVEEAPVVGGPKIVESGGTASGGHAPVQPDFRAADHRQGMSEAKGRDIFRDALERGQAIDGEQSEMPKPPPPPPLPKPNPPPKPGPRPPRPPRPR